MNKYVSMSILLLLFLVSTTIFITAWLFLFDLPVVAKDINRECKYVMSSSPDHSCDNLPEKYTQIIVSSKIKQR